MASRPVGPIVAAVLYTEGENPLSLDYQGRLRVSEEPRLEGSGLVIVSHNWADRTTWYSQSERVTGQVLTDSGDGLTFTSPDEFWIDLTHGKLYREDLVSAGKTPKIYVDSVQKTERTPFAESGGDFTIDYREGTVTFASSQSGKTITADYSKENGSAFVIAPLPGKRLWLERSEVQFASNVVINDTIHFQPWAYNPYDPPNKVPVDNPTSYKVARDFVDEACGCYPKVAAFGGTVRGLQNDHIVFPFNYVLVKDLKSSYGVEIRVWLENDQEFGGEFATATFYCTSYDEE